MSYVVSVLAVVSIRVRDGITRNLAKGFPLTSLRGNKEHIKNRLGNLAGHREESCADVRLVLQTTK